MKVLVLGAGGPAGVNTCRALKAAGHYVWAQDDDFDHLDLVSDYVDGYGAPMGGFDLVLPQPDRSVLDLVLEKDAGPTFLPALSTILTCQDKFEAGLCWRRAGLREDRTTLVD